MRILIPDAQFSGEPEIEQGVAPAGASFDVFRERDPAAIPDEVWRGCDAIIVWHAMPLPAAVIERLESCRIIVRAGIGCDRIDLAACAARGIPVSNCPDYGTTDVADHAIGLLLALSRGIGLFQTALREDLRAGWRFNAPPLMGRLRGRTFAVVGLGRIGTAAARRARALDMRIVFYDPYIPQGQELALGFTRLAHLEDLLEQAEVLSLHAPLTEETRGMIGSAALARLPEGAILINTARGGLVDLDALYDGLMAERPVGAGLDVLPEEPPDPAHPLLRAFRDPDSALQGRLLLTPHAAFYSPAGMVELRRKPVQTVTAFVTEGRLLSCVNGVTAAASR